MRRVAVAVVTVAVALVIATAAIAAAPRLILVDQGGLELPVVLADWSENGTFLSEWLRARPVAGRSLKGRPSYRLSFMWGPFWSDFVASRESLRAVRPSDTEFHGWFWPAWRGRPALVDPDHGVLVGARRATPTQLRILRRSGVPISVRG